MKKPQKYCWLSRERDHPIGEPGEAVEDSSRAPRTKTPAAMPIAAPLRELRDLLGDLGLGELDLLADEELGLLGDLAGCAATIVGCELSSVLGWPRRSGSWRRRGRRRMQRRPASRARVGRPARRRLALPSSRRAAGRRSASAPWRRRRASAPARPSVGAVRLVGRSLRADPRRRRGARSWRATRVVGDRWPSAPRPASRPDHTSRLTSSLSIDAQPTADGPAQLRSRPAQIVSTTKPLACSYSASPCGSSRRSSPSAPARSPRRTPSRRTAA